MVELNLDKLTYGVRYDEVEKAYIAFPLEYKYINSEYGFGYTDIEAIQDLKKSIKEIWEIYAVCYIKDEDKLDDNAKKLAKYLIQTFGKEV